MIRKPRRRQSLGGQGHSPVPHGLGIGRHLRMELVAGRKDETHRKSRIDMCLCHLQRQQGGPHACKWYPFFDTSSPMTSSPAPCPLFLPYLHLANFVSMTLHFHWANVRLVPLGFQNDLCLIDLTNRRKPHSRVPVTYVTPAWACRMRFSGCEDSWHQTHWNRFTDKSFHGSKMES